MLHTNIKLADIGMPVTKEHFVSIMMSCSIKIGMRNRISFQTDLTSQPINFVFLQNHSPFFDQALLKCMVIHVFIKFQTDSQGKQCRPIVCHSVSIFWMHYSMVKPHCSNFRIITANVSVV